MTTKETIERDGRTWIEIPYTAHGDYVGCTVERANTEAILERYKGKTTRFNLEDWKNGYMFVWDGKHTNEETIELMHNVLIVELWSDYGYTVLYGLSGEPDIEEIIEQLKDYPLYDDDYLSELEREMDDEYITEEIVDTVMRRYLIEIDAYCKKYDCTEADVRCDVADTAYDYIRDENLEFIYEQAFQAYLRETDDVIQHIVETLFKE